MSIRDLRHAVSTAAIDALLGRATARAELAEHAGKSGAYLERVTIDGNDLIVKYQDIRRDWTMRAGGVLHGATYELWSRGLLDTLPGCFDQPIIAVAKGPREGDARGKDVTVLVMRDVGSTLIPTSDTTIKETEHRQFLDHMAALHAAFWQAGPEIDIVPPMTRYMELSPWTARTEADLGSDHRVPQLIAQGWPLLEQVAPEAARVVLPLALDPWPLVDALNATPLTLVHGNFKLDNLGVTPDGRTVVLDWEGTGRGAATSDLAWYLAINCRRLPDSKEDTIAAYRAALERHGIDTAPWWDRQLALSLLGGLVLFGWEKAFGGLDDELAWWQEKALAGERLLRS